MPQTVRLFEVPPGGMPRRLAGDVGEVEVVLADLAGNRRSEAIGPGSRWHVLHVPDSLQQQLLLGVDDLRDDTANDRHRSGQDGPVQNVGAGDTEDVLLEGKGRAPRGYRDAIYLRCLVEVGEPVCRAHVAGLGRVEPVAEPSVVGAGEGHRNLPGLLQGGVHRYSPLHKVARVNLSHQRVQQRRIFLKEAGYDFARRRLERLRVGARHPIPTLGESHMHEVDTVHEIVLDVPAEGGEEHANVHVRAADTGQIRGLLRHERSVHLCQGVLVPTRRGQKHLLHVRRPQVHDPFIPGRFGILGANVAAVLRLQVLVPGVHSRPVPPLQSVHRHRQLRHSKNVLGDPLAKHSQLELLGMRFVFLQRVAPSRLVPECRGAENTSLRPRFDHIPILAPPLSRRPTGPVLVRGVFCPFLPRNFAPLPRYTSRIMQFLHDPARIQGVDHRPRTR
mmetsp:Transcript_6502/g.18417  ORF Transcript_6502/g.18417 Transcript_6502/m.18417 type:complete len:447 (-) Transcript_6502:1840-3180(-)